MTPPLRFVPHTDKHSIEQVAFSLMLDSRVAEDELEKIYSEPRFRKEGAYAHMFRHLGVTTGIGSFPQGLQPVVFPSAPHMIGVQMCSDVPVEKADRTLFIAADQLTVITRVYETWQKTAPCIFKDITCTIGHCDDPLVNSISLTYRDRFVSTENTANSFEAAEMFRDDRSPYIMASLTHQNTPWHSQCGFWENDDILINLAAQRQILHDKKTEITLEIQCTKHYPESIFLKDKFLVDVYDPLHKIHRKMMQEIFEEAVLNRIGMCVDNGAVL